VAHVDHSPLEPPDSDEGFAVLIHEAEALSSVEISTLARTA
jgi:hypothetical protein